MCFVKDVDPSVIKKLRSIVLNNPMKAEEIAEAMGMMQCEPTLEFREILFLALRSGAVVLNTDGLLTSA